MKRYAVIPTGDRPIDYASVIQWCKYNEVNTVTIATTPQAKRYAVGKTIRNDDLNISHWWNLGLDWVAAKEFESDDDYSIAVLNDDVVLPDDWYERIETAIKDGASGASGERSRGSDKVAGYAFMLNGKHDIRADEEIVWYYTDDAIQRKCEDEGGFILIPNITVENKYARSSEKKFLPQILKDRDLYYKKYGAHSLDVTVVVATFGNETWEKMGDDALLSAQASGAKTLRVHLPTGTLAEARNNGLNKVNTEYVVFLDADDDLAHNYFENVKPTADVTVTAIDYARSGRSMIPKVWSHEKIASKRHLGDCKAECLVDGNWVHVGAICRTEAVKSVGGFKEYPVYEDWTLFLEMQQNGATFDRNEKSVYHASVRLSPQHRNKSLPLEERNKIHEQIIKDILGS